MARRSQVRKFTHDAAMIASGKAKSKRVGHALPDIAKRKMADETLRESEAKYRTLADQSVEGIVIAQSLPLRLVFANPALGNILGYSPDELKSLSPKEIEGLVHSEDRKTFFGRFSDRLQGKPTSPRYEFRAVRKDGDLRWMEIAANRIDYHGQPALQATCVDITKRKRAEEELQESEQLYRTLAESSPDIIFIVRKDTSVQYMNKSGLERFGLVLEDVVGKKASDLFSPEVAKRLAGPISTVFQTGKPIRAENELLFQGVASRRDDHWIPLKIGNETPAVLGISRDITERFQMLRTLEESERRFKDMATSSGDWIWEVDNVGKYTHADGKVAQILGYTPKELIGKTPFELMPEDEAERVARLFRQIVSEKKNIVDLENWNLTKNGERVCLLTNGVPIIDANGDLLGYRGVDKDITERKRMEQELSQYSTHLEELVRERTEESRSTRERLDYLIKSNPAVIYSGVPTADSSNWQSTYMSDRVTGMLGYAPEDFIGHPEFWTSHVHPDDLQAAMEAVQDLKKEGQSICTYRFQHKDGSYRWIREETIADRDINGRLIGVYGCLIDVTDHVRLLDENKKLNAQLVIRLVSVTDQIESLSNLRERLKKAPDVPTGLDLVLDSIIWGFGMDFGGIFVIDHDANRANVRASKGRAPEFHLSDSYPLGSFVELEDLQSMSVTKVVGADERSVFGAATVLLVPILSVKGLYGLLALGSLDLNPQDPSAIRILESYAEIIYSFMIERSIIVRPAPEVTTPGERTVSLEPGQIYLVKNDPAKALDIFVKTVFGGYEGLCITRTYPPTVRHKYGLEKTPVVWLTGEATAGEQSVRSIQELSILIGDFLGKAKKPVILLDGFEYIVTNSGFDPFIRFLQILKDRLQSNGGVLIASLLEEAVAPKELALVQRETTPWVERE